MLLGVLRNLSNIHDYTTTILKHHGGTLMFKGPCLTNINFILTSDPLNVLHITSRNFGNYGRAILHSLFKNESFGRFLQQIIQKKLESCLLPFLNHASKTGVQFIEFSEFAYEKAFNKMEDAIFYRHIVPRCLWKLQKWLQIGQEKKFNESQKMAKGKEQIDDKFLRDTAINLQAAGRDTISAGLRWLFWLVSTHPLVEAKILEEIKDNFKTNEENCLASGVKGLDKLVYLHGAICEAFRLFPPVPFEHNPNTMVYYSLYSMGRMEQTWRKDCLEFRPERWISEKGGNIHVPSYKSCLDRNISFVQMKIVVIALLWNFKVQVVEGHHVSPSVSVVLHMKHGLKVKVTKR
ncbi:hypothetical protein GYH30_032535 [Glycine max]|uniref:Cytochrome P450 n=1 Tax=Glycine max TaxID=3847 RepID=K7LSS8_SOYBN|nr:hypothetical protein GYH30_032535 [Glycine max]